MSQILVRETGLQDANWSFESNLAQWRPIIDGRPCHAGGTTLDPFPGYSHDLKQVKDAVSRVEDLFTPQWDVHLFVSDREGVGRTNAYSTYSGNWGDDRIERPVDYGVIFFHGKRIPPHPAMTRHLVAHEYGHQIEWMLEVASGKGIGKRDFVAEYAEMRGLDTRHHGDGGNWHNAPSEIFACDFRILVCQTEHEYWPHPDVAHPFAVPGLKSWWTETLQKFG